MEQPLLYSWRILENNPSLYGLIAFAMFLVTCIVIVKLKGRG